MIRYFVVALAFVTANLFAQEQATYHDLYTVLDTVFIPPIHYVGDVVELRLVIKPKERLKVLKSRELTQQNAIMIKDVYIQNVEDLVKIFVRFVSFSPGSKILPPIPLGDIVLKDIRIFTSSIIDDKSVLEMLPAREPLLLPQTELYCAGLLVGFFLLPFLAIKIRAPLRAWLVFLQRQHKKKLPGRAFQREYKSIQQKINNYSGPEFYTKLVQILRAYLSSKFQLDLEALTVKELELRLFPLTLETTAVWIRFLRRADMIRFDSQEPSFLQRKQDLDEIQKAVFDLENREKTYVKL